MFPQHLDLTFGDLHWPRTLTSSVGLRLFVVLFEIKDLLSQILLTQNDLKLQ